MRKLASTSLELARTINIRVVQFVFLERGFDKVCESSRNLELFEGFDVLFWKTGPWAPTPTLNLPIRCVLFIYIYRGIKGARMGPCHHCRAEKGEP